MQRAWILIVALLVAALVWTDRHPVRLPSSTPRAAAALHPRDAGHPVLLLVDAEGLRASGRGRASTRRADLEWDNLLTQAFGGCDVGALVDLDSLVDGRDLVVLPRQTAAALGEDQRRRLEAAVESGLDVLVEAPDSTLCRQFGLELAAVERRSRLPWPRPMVQASDPGRVLRPEAINIPWTRYRYAPPPLSQRSRPSVHLSLDGRPLGWVSRRAEGSWIVLAMDLGDLATRIRQGESPAPPDPGPTTADLALAALSGADHAWLDGWVEGVFGGELTDTPLPRVATAPYDFDGWVVVSADTLVDDPRVSSFLAVSDAGPGADGLLGAWRSGEDRRVGIGPLRPFVRSTDLGAQVAALEARTDGPIRMHRAAGGRWSADPDESFSIVAGAGLTIDSSFGVPGTGWASGSGVPFLPLAGSGLRFALHEVVVHARTREADADPGRVDRWLRHNATGGAGPVHVVVSPATDLADLTRQAGRRGHRIARPEELVEWWEARRRVRVRARPVEDGLELRIEEPGDGGFALLVPVRWREGSLAGWDADWGIARSRRVQRFDRAYRLIELDPRARGGTLRLRYL